MKVSVTLFFLFFTFSIQAQVKDTVKKEATWVMENVPKPKFWGNSWYASASYNLSRSNEFDLNVGRTYGKVYYTGSFGMNTMKSWGLGYGIINRNGETKQIVKAFMERCVFSYAPLTAAVRADYIYNLSDDEHYLRPSVGASFLYFDVLYNYSFLLNTSGKENDFRHGVTFRLKYYFGMKNWQKNKTAPR